MLLQYHQQAFDKLGIKPEEDPAASALLIEREAALGIRFPPSVREFYALRDAQRILAGAFDIVTPLDQLGHDYSPELPLMQIFHDWYGPPSLYIHLDGKPDPNIRMITDGHEDKFDANGLPGKIVGPFSQVVREQVDYLLEAEARSRKEYELRNASRSPTVISRILAVLRDMFA